MKISVKDLRVGVSEEQCVLDWCKQQFGESSLDRWFFQYGTTRQEGWKWTSVTIRDEQDAMLFLLVWG